MDSWFPKVMIFEADIVHSSAWGEQLEIDGYRVESCSLSRHAASRVEHYEPRFLLVDVQLFGQGFDSFMEAIRPLPCFHKMILVGIGDLPGPELEQQSLQYGFDAFARSTMDSAEIVRFLDKLFELAMLQDSDSEVSLVESSSGASDAIQNAHER